MRRMCPFRRLSLRESSASFARRELATQTPVSRYFRGAKGHERGLTLIEVVLAIGLTTVLLALVATAIHLHLRVLDRGRADVEQAQLARVLLQRIAADLRSAVPHDPETTQSLMAAMTASGASASGGGLSSGGDTAGLAGLSDSSGSTSGTSSLSQRDTSDTSTLTDVAVGLYGTASWLQVDTTRLPRVDQMAANPSATFDPASGQDRLSDVKTVVYFIQPARGDGTPGGLVRRELDRAATSYASQQGATLDADENLVPLAPEVSAIEFRYYDGYEYFDYWDMSERNALPMAVEILLEMKPAMATPSDSPFDGAFDQAASGNAGKPSAQPIVYRLMVRIPTATPTSADGSTTESTTDTSSSTSGGTSGGGTSE